MMLALTASALLTVATATQAAATQPVADLLLDDARLAAVLTEIDRAPRARVEVIGRSHEGRPLPMVIVARPEVLRDLDRHLARAGALAGPRIERQGLGKARLVARDIDALLEGTAVPVLFAGASWGNEASAVEGLVAAARKLAFEDDEAVRRALANTVALIVPLMNPDGRAAALREWERTPRSNGNSGIGNARGFLINRDFVHATQPESRAIVETLLRYRPVMAVDMHEDVYSLGVRLEEVAFVEPFAPGFDVEEHPATRDAIRGAGAAIAARWKELGFRTLFDPQGDNRFAPLPAPGDGINPVASSAGRLNLMASLHGTTSYITESARTPGSQSWRDRVAQKSSAVLATLAAVSDDPKRYARAVYERRRDRLREIGDRFVVIPKQEGSGRGRSRLLELLHLHRIDVFRVEQPQPGLVVPLAQPEGEMAQHLLAPVRSVLNLVPPALGLHAVPSERLDAEQRRAYRAAELYPAEAPAGETPVPKRKHAQVALYVGQGVARHDWGEVAWALEAGGFAYRRVDETVIAEGTALSEMTALVVPAGSAGEIVHGWDDSGTVRRPPWQPAQPSEGIGEAGLAAIRDFVGNGGVYIGLGGGGAALAGDDHLSISTAEPVPAAIGLGPVRLTSARPDLPVLRHFDASAPAAAFFFAPPGGPAKGFAFRTEDNAVLRYAGAIAWPPERSFTSPALLAPDPGHAAVVYERYGQGHVVLFGIAPAFRGQWPATAELVYAALALD